MPVSDNRIKENEFSSLNEAVTGQSHDHDNLYARVLDVSDHLQKLASDPRRVALLVIDVQEVFCSEKYRGNVKTEEMATEIGRIAPAFRDAGIPVYSVYFDPKALLYTRILRDEGGYYHFRLDQDKDIEVRKTTTNAFHSSDLADKLKNNGHTDLLFCGFNLTACVSETMKSAFDHVRSVTLLKDLSCNGGLTRTPEKHKEDYLQTLAMLEKSGGYACDSDEVLGALTLTSPKPS